MFDDARPQKELNSTKESASLEQFEGFLRRLETAGANVIMDEEVPLFYDAGKEHIKVGERREVQFNINRTDFLVIRELKRRRILGAGHKKSFEDLPVPIIDLKLKKKSELVDQWEFVDMDELFS